MPKTVDLTSSGVSNIFSALNVQPSHDVSAGLEGASNKCSGIKESSLPTSSILYADRELGPFTMNRERGSYTTLGQRVWNSQPTRNLLSPSEFPPLPGMSNADVKKCTSTVENKPWRDIVSPLAVSSGSDETSGDSSVFNFISDAIQKTQTKLFSPQPQEDDEKKEVDECGATSPKKFDVGEVPPGWIAVPPRNPKNVLPLLKLPEVMEPQGQYLWGANRHFQGQNIWGVRGKPQAQQSWCENGQPQRCMWGAIGEPLRKKFFNEVGQSKGQDSFNGVGRFQKPRFFEHGVQSQGQNIFNGVGRFKKPMVLENGGQSQGQAILKEIEQFQKLSVLEHSGQPQGQDILEENEKFQKLSVLEHGGQSQGQCIFNGVRQFQKSIVFEHGGTSQDQDIFNGVGRSQNPIVLENSGRSREKDIFDEVGQFENPSVLKNDISNHEAFDILDQTKYPKWSLGEEEDKPTEKRSYVDAWIQLLDKEDQLLDTKNQSPKACGSFDSQGQSFNCQNQSSQGWNQYSRVPLYERRSSNPNFWDQQQILQSVSRSTSAESTSAVSAPVASTSAPSAPVASASVFSALDTFFKYKKEDIKAYTNEKIQNAYSECRFMIQIVNLQPNHADLKCGTHLIKPFKATFKDPHGLEHDVYVQNVPMIRNSFLGVFYPTVSGPHVISVYLNNDLAGWKVQPDSNYEHVKGSPFIITISKNYTVESRQVVLRIGEYGLIDSGNNSGRCWGVAAEEIYSDHIFVTNREQHHVSVFNATGKFLYKFGQTTRNKAGVRNLFRPSGIVCDNFNSRLLVADKDNHRIAIFSLEGGFVGSFGNQGHENGQFLFPWDVDCTRNGDRIAVADSKNHRIQVFDKFGNFLNKFSAFETNPFVYKMILDDPRGISFDQEGEYIYVTDFTQEAVVRIKADCSKSERVPTPKRTFGRLQGITVDNTGNVLVCDTRRNAIRVLHPRGLPVTTVGAVDNIPLFSPYDITTMRGGLVAVLDYNGRVRVF